MLNDKLQEILSALERHSAITGLSIEKHIESLVVFLAERKKGNSFEESAQTAVAFLDEKKAIAIASSNRHADNKASCIETFLNYNTRTDKFQVASGGPQWVEAERKAQIVKDYWKSNLSPENFLRRYNQSITKSQLYRWQKKYRDSGQDIRSLIDCRGGHNRGKSSIQSDIWDCFYNMYMTPHRRSIQECWTFTKEQYQNIPSISSFERRVKKIPLYEISKLREV